MRKDKKPSYVRQAKTARTAQRVLAIPAKVFPQWLRTALMVLVWLGSVPLYVSSVAPYVAYQSATVMTVSLAMFSGIAVHVWPTRTSPWRTVAWAWVGSLAVGLLCLSLYWGRYALTLACITGFLIVIARCNQNARKLAGLIKTWREMR